MEHMIESIFIEVLNMSLTASVIILAVFLVRVLLKKAPRIYTYALWAIVLFRLLCPISFESNVSLLGFLQSESAVEGRMEYISQDIGYQMEPEVHMPMKAVDNIVNRALPAGNPQSSVNPLQVILYLAVRVWILGMAVLVIYSGVSLWNLQKQLKTAVWERDHIYRIQGKHSPFVYGIFSPCIYLPDHLDENEMEYVILHEQIHIKRGDHIYRLLAYLTVCIHWFNPLVWAAFSFSGRDMEVSCDEAVIRNMGSEIKKEYSASLLNLACGDKIVKGIPVAFGESDTGNRIKHVLKYRKPAKMLVITAVAACVILTIVLLANPASEQYSVYGVIGYADLESEGILQRIVRIPRFGDVLIPGSEKIIPYEGTKNENLEIGDLVKIVFRESETAIEETDPGRFSHKAKIIKVLGKGYSVEPVGDGLYRIAIPLSEAKLANAGDLLEMKRDGRVLQNYEIVATNGDESHVFIELGLDEVETYFRNAESGVEYMLAIQEKTEEAEESEEVKLDPANPEDGTYSINIRSISRSARCIDRYVADTTGEEMPKLFFDEACVFMVNTEMAKVHYEKVTFEEFADFIKDKKEYTNAPCTVTFENGLIKEIVLKSAYVRYGISYQPFTRENWSWNTLTEVLDEVKGEERSGTTGIYFTLREEISYDISDCEGEELIEVYAGDAGDGNCGNVEFKTADGIRIHTEFVHTSRVGWNSFYLGEAEGVKYILKLHIEDRDNTGVYSYQVYRLGKSIRDKKLLSVKQVNPGEILQIAGSEFTWGDGYLYDDSIFKEWVSDLEYYLEHSFLILSSQNGEIRTEQICELDKYNYETLKRE